MSDSIADSDRLTAHVIDQIIAAIHAGPDQNGAVHRNEFIVQLQLRPGADGIRDLRHLLKILGRYHHTRCISARAISGAP
jgi:hypothetical protein